MEQNRILIMGVGNILLTDEGFGVRAVEHLEANYAWPENVRLLDGGTQGLMPILRPHPSRSRPTILPKASRKMKQPISRATLSSL